MRTASVSCKLVSGTETRGEPKYAEKIAESDHTRDPCLPKQGLRLKDYGNAWQGIESIQVQQTVSV
jgi:hypothetical protein